MQLAYVMGDAVSDIHDVQLQALPLSLNYRLSPRASGHGQVAAPYLTTITSPMPSAKVQPLVKVVHKKVSCILCRKIIPPRAVWIGMVGNTLWRQQTATP